MRKFIKIVFFIIIILVLLIVIGGFLAAKFINPNHYKDKIIAAVHNKTGRDLVIGGDIELSFFPWVGARVNDVRLSNAAGFAPQDRFMSVGEADVSVKLMPLLSRRIEVGKITLKDVDINLAKNKVGLTNWQDLTSRQSSTISTSSSSSASATQPVTAAFAISFAGINIENANISWIDAQKGQNVQLHHVNINSENPQENKSFPVSITFDINSNKPAIDGKFSFKSDVIVSTQTGTYRLNQPQLSFTPQKNSQALKFQANSALVDTHQQTLNVTDATITGAGLNAKLKTLTGQQIMSRPLLNGDLQIAPFNLKAFLKNLGKTVATTDPNALQQVSLATQFAATPTSVRLNPLTIRLDNSTVQGSANVENGATQVVNFDLAVDQINVDRYMPPKTQASTTTTVTPTTAAGAAASSQSDAMRKANINGKLRVGSLTVADTSLSQVYAQIALVNGVLRVDPLKANVYKGSTTGRVVVDYRTAVPVYTLDETLSNIDMTQLVKSGKLIGRANLVSHLTLRGQDKNTMLSSLNGNVQFNLQNGALVGKDIPYEVERAIAVIKRQPLPPASTKNQTDFDVFKGTGTFTNGLFSNNDLLIQSSKFKATGSGTANLITEALNYRLMMVGLHAINDAQGNLVQEERQTQIPVLITGTFDHPVITPDMAALLKSQVGQKAIQKASDKLEERLGPGAGKAIGGALRQLLNQ